LPSQAIDYSDHHRTVIGYHGTDMAAAERLVSGEEFQPSDADNEWFGKGVYFWEHAFKQAWRWSRDYKRFGRPAVVGAVIRLGNRLDLVDPGNVTVFREFSRALLDDYARAKVAPPRNFRTHKRLDCAVFNYMYGHLERANRPLDTARAVYYPLSGARRVVKGSWISEETHIQICVRNPRSVLAVWHVREDGRHGRRTAGVGAPDRPGGAG